VYCKHLLRLVDTAQNRLYNIIQRTLNTPVTHYHYKMLYIKMFWSAINLMKKTTFLR